MTKRIEMTTTGHEMQPQHTPTPEPEARLGTCAFHANGRNEDEWLPHRQIPSCMDWREIGTCSNRTWCHPQHRHIKGTACTDWKPLEPPEGQEAQPLGTCDSDDTPHVQAYWEDLQPAVGLEGSGFTEGHYCTNWKPAPQPPVVSGGERLVIECEPTSATHAGPHFVPGTYIRPIANSQDCWCIVSIRWVPAAAGGESAPDAGLRTALEQIGNRTAYSPDPLVQTIHRMAQEALAVPAPAAPLSHSFSMSMSDGTCLVCGRAKGNHQSAAPAEPGGGWCDVEGDSSTGIVRCNRTRGHEGDHHGEGVYWTNEGANTPETRPGGNKG